MYDPKELADIDQSITVYKIRANYIKKYYVYFGVFIYLMISFSKFRGVNSFKLAYRVFRLERYSVRSGNIV